MLSNIVFMFFFIDQTRLLESDITLESSSGLTIITEGVMEGSEGFWRGLGDIRGPWRALGEPF